MNSKLILEQMIEYDKNIIQENELGVAAGGLIAGLVGSGVVGSIILLSFFLDKKRSISSSVKRYDIDKKQSENLRKILLKRVNEINNTDESFINELKSDLILNGKYKLFKSDLNESYKRIKNYGGGPEGNEGFNKENEYYKDRMISNTIVNKGVVGEIEDIKETLKYLLTKFK